MFATLGFVLVCYLIADFISGVWHWWDDTYSGKEWPLVGKWLPKPNFGHHEQPQEFLNQSYWARNGIVIIANAIAFSIFVLLGSPFCLVFLFLSQANEIHAFAHKKGKVSKFVLMLQEVGAFQSPRQHGWHHREPHLDNYCVMRNWLNPILDYFKVWRGLEWLIRLAFITPKR